MVARVTHAKVSGKPQGSDPARVYGTHWDADHVVVGLDIGTDVQAHDATLDALSGKALLGTGDIVLSSTLSGYQPLDSDLTAIAALTTTAYGRSLLTLANATALAAETDSFFLTPAEGNAAYQPLDSDLTALAASGISFSANVASTGIPGLSNQPIIVHEALSAAPASVAALRAQFDVSYTTLNAGTSYAALWGFTNVQAGVQDSFYGALGNLHNHSTSGEQVGTYMQAWRYADGNTWASVAEGRDLTGAADPTKTLCAIEADIFANGTDANHQRIGVEVVVGKHNSGGAAAVATYGFRLVPYNNDTSQGSFTKGLSIETNVTDGIDLHSVTASHSALWMADGHKILFDTAGTRALLYSATALHYSISGSDILSVTDGGSIAAAGSVTGTSFIPSSSTVPTNGLYLPAANTLGWSINSTAEMRLTSAALSPATSDGNALGTTALMWADLFLASGGVVNFNNGDVTLTHASDLLTLDGGKFSVSDATDASSTTVASVALAGGLGIAKKLYVGDGIFPGPGTFASGVSQIYRSATNGLVITGSTGSSFDFGFYTPAGSELMVNPTGTVNFNFAGSPRFRYVTAPPAGGASSSGMQFSSTTGLGIYWGSGVPTLSAAQGSIYVRTDGSSTSTRLYVNTTGSTTWTNFTSAA